MQSSTARVLLDAGDVEAARARVEAVETTSRSAMLEMRQLLGVLRDEHTAALDPSPTLSDLTALVDAARDGGIHPTLVVTGDVSRVPQHVAVTAYRVAQESLTNVIKHAAGAQVDVRVDVREDGLRLTVVDTGGPLRASHKDGGHGLVGIDERVALAGGEVSAGPVERGRGWQVSAVLPFESQQ